MFPYWPPPVWSMCTPHQAWWPPPHALDCGDDGREPFDPLGERARGAPGGDIPPGLGLGHAAQHSQDEADDPPGAARPRAALLAAGLTMEQLEALRLLRRRVERMPSHRRCPHVVGAAAESEQRRLGFWRWLAQHGGLDDDLAPAPGEQVPARRRRWPWALGLLLRRGKRRG